MKSLIIGKGQIGEALFEIFSKHHECKIRDVEDLKMPGVEVLHICFPYSKRFVDHVNRYIKQYDPKIIFIHSSVAVGTTDRFGPSAVHSPERGRFPNLAKEMVVFPKYIGTPYELTWQVASKYIEDCGWKTVRVKDSRMTEFLKLQSNIHLGMEIAWRQEVGRMLESLRLRDTSIYESWEDSYNKGHKDLGHEHLIRPRLKSDPIGGHCILPCTDILSSQAYSEAFEFIRRSNAKRKEEVARAASPGVGEAHTTEPAIH